MKKLVVTMTTEPMRTAAFAATPMVAIPVLAVLIGGAGSTELDRLIGEAALLFGGIGALIGFIAGWASAK